MVYTTVLVLILILVATITFLSQIGFMYWYRKGIDTLSPLSLLGCLANILFKKEPWFVNIQNFYNAMKRKGNKFGGYYFLMRPVFVPTDLDLIRKMMISDFDHFTDHIGYCNEKTDPITLNLFIAKGMHWRNFRLLLTPSFTSAKSKMMLDTAIKCVEDLKQLINKCIDGKKPIVIKDVSERFTTDVIVSYGFGMESKTLRNANSEFKRITEKVVKSFRLVLVFAFPELFSIFGLRSFGEEISNLFINLVVETAEYRKKNGIVRQDFIHDLLQHSGDVTTRNSGMSVKANRRDVRLSLSEIAAQCYIFYAAGYETSATAINFTLIEMALNQEIQNKVRKEIKAVLKKHGGKITYEAVKEMKYLDNCLNESLRMYPPVPMSTRLCTKTYKIPNTDAIINEGMYVFLPIYAVHRDPEYFPNPNKFDPDRFSKGTIKKYPGFMPFGDGPRKCIGYKFAFLQTKVALVSLIKHFKFFIHPDVDVPLQFNSLSVALNTISPLKVIAEKLE